MSSSKLNSCFGVGGSGGFLEGFGGLSRNPFGGDNIMSLLTLFRGTGLGFTFSHFPVLGGGVGLFSKIEPIDLLYCEVLELV